MDALGQISPSISRTNESTREKRSEAEKGSLVPFILLAWYKDEVSVRRGADAPQKENAHFPAQPDSVRGIRPMKQMHHPVQGTSPCLLAQRVRREAIPELIRRRVRPVPKSQREMSCLRRISLRNWSAGLVRPAFTSSYPCS